MVYPFKQGSIATTTVQLRARLPVPALTVSAGGGWAWSQGLPLAVLGTEYRRGEQVRFGVDAELMLFRVPFDRVTREWDQARVVRALSIERESDGTRGLRCASPSRVFGGRTNASQEPHDRHVAGCRAVPHRSSVLGDAPIVRLDNRGVCFAGELAIQLVHHRGETLPKLWSDISQQIISGIIASVGCSTASGGLGLRSLRDEESLPWIPLQRTLVKL